VPLNFRHSDYCPVDHNPQYVPGIFNVEILLDAVKKLSFSAMPNSVE